MDVADLRGEAASERLREIERLQHRLDAARVDLVDVWDADGTWALDGSTSGAAWMAHRMGLSGAQARERVRVARWLRDAPLVRAALGHGRLTWAKVVLFPRYVTEGCRERFVEDEAWLVDTCAGLRVEHCRRVLRYWASRADPDGADRDDAARWERRSMTVAEAWDGMGDVRANLTPEALLVLQTLLDRIAEELWRDERAEDPAAVVRTAAQRRHDAFVELLRRAASWDEQNAKGARPSLVAYLDHEIVRTRAADEARRRARAERSMRLPTEHPSDAASDEQLHVDQPHGEPAPRERPAVLAGAGGRGPVRAGPASRSDRSPPGPAPPGVGQVGEQCEQEPRGSALACGWDGPVITRATAQRWLCEADVCRLLMGPGSEVLDLGRTQRLFSAAQRKAIIKGQGGTCIWPDCDRPAGWLEIHHVHEWDRDDGRTDLANGVAACSFHHHRLHEGGFRIQRDPAAPCGYTFHRPDGTEISW